MTDPVQRLGIGNGRVSSRRNGWVGRARSRFQPTDAEWAVISGLACAAVPIGAAALVLFGARAAAIVVAAIMAGISVLGRRVRRRHARQVADALPAALAALARDIRTGASFGSAIARQGEAHGPMSPLFRRVHAAIELGQAVDQACAALAIDGRQVGDDATVVGVLAMVSGGGRGSARALDEAAHAARQRQVIRDEIRALIAQAESSVRLLAGLPVLFVAVAILTGQSGATLLVDSAVGRWCLAGGLVFDGAGLLWMRLLVRSVAT